MGRAKDISIKPIPCKDARRVIAALHYSGGSVKNSQVNLGVFLDGKLGGAMQLGPCLMASQMVGLVRGSRPREFLELNRMAFADWLPRNSESRALGVACRMLARAYPHLKWLISYADATRCGDGTIYRAAGFLLTDVKVNRDIKVDPATGDVVHKITAHTQCRVPEWRTWTPIHGHFMRYIKFLHPAERENLAVPVIPYSAIKDAGASMYKGKAVQ